MCGCHDIFVINKRSAAIGLTVFRKHGHPRILVHESRSAPEDSILSTQLSAGLSNTRNKMSFFLFHRFDSKSWIHESPNSILTARKTRSGGKERLGDWRSFVFYRYSLLPLDVIDVRRRSDGPGTIFDRRKDLKLKINAGTEHES